jgi:hypothetical protein
LEGQREGVTLPPQRGREEACRSRRRGGREVRKGEAGTLLA